MRLVLKRDWEAFDGAQIPTRVTLPAGVHEVERVVNPRSPGATPWLVLKDTLIGAAETWWTQHDYGDEDEFTVVVLDDDGKRVQE